ncbi:MAG: CsbD family protein [Oscillochloridaceae bacterium umkhey_bin13]
MALNWDIIKGQWKEFKGEARQQWGKLTDDDWDQIAGERDKLYGRLQQHYGWTREQAEKEADRFFGATHSR